MAEQRRTTYPSIPTKNWWDLRKQLNRTPTAQVTPSYLATVLKLTEASAKNLLPPLTAIGLIDESGKLSSLGQDWRHDEQYADVCRRIMDSIYPDELRHALPCPDPDRRSVETWFGRATGSGEAAATKMALFYLLLCTADASAQDQQAAVDRGNGRVGAREEQGRPRSPRRETRRPAAPAPPVASEPVPMTPPVTSPRAAVTGPSLHIDVQIHIAADARSEQIDQVFASMAKHFGLGNGQ